jgi:protein TonB
MKYLVLLLSLVAFSAVAQNSENYDYNKNIKVKADYEPYYPAGEMALYELVFNKLEYSRDAIDRKVRGESMINFDVNPDSTLSGFSIIKEVGYGIDKSIINILMQLKFSPGVINGKPVVKNMVLTFPIETE